MLSSLLSAYVLGALKIDNIRETRVEAVQTQNAKLEDFENFKKIPLKDPYHIAPVIDAKASIAMDIDTDTILYEKNIHTRLPVASITKLMTTLVVLEENNLDDIVTVSRKAAGTLGSTMYLQAGEKIKLHNLLYGMMINSANDAAVAVAEYNAGNIDAFVEKMNKKALQLGLVNTNYSNPIGLDQKNNYSSAYDLAKLSKYIYQKHFIKEAAAMKELTVYSIDGKYTHKLESTNQLLDSYLKVKGLKTGKTESAGLCFIGIAENNDGHEIITIMLNSPARFQESKILIDWVFTAYNW